jgi:hypothetical protein
LKRLCWIADLSLPPRRVESLIRFSAQIIFDFSTRANRVDSRSTTDASFEFLQAIVYSCTSVLAIWC